VGTAPAIANAVADALGTPAAFDLPITAEAVIGQAKQRRS
jgi:CO/xanthine dehydrogenase Mo-binding subunit